MKCNLKGRIDNYRHYDVEMKVWMQKWATIMCKLNGWIDKDGHYDMEIKGWMEKVVL